MNPPRLAVRIVPAIFLLAILSLARAGEEPGWSAVVNGVRGRAFFERPGIENPSFHSLVIELQAAPRSPKIISLPPKHLAFRVTDSKGRPILGTGGGGISCGAFSWHPVPMPAEKKLLIHFPGLGFDAAAHQLAAEIGQMIPARQLTAKIASHPAQSWQIPRKGDSRVAITLASPREPGSPSGAVWSGTLALPAILIPAAE